VADQPPLGFEDWYRREHPRVLGSMVALCGDVEMAAEVTDEAFARALARWSRVSALASPGGWTYTVALNVLRRAKRRRGGEHAALTKASTGADAPRDPELPDVDLWAAVRRLPDRQRTAVVLRYVADLPESEIAQVLGVARGTVASQLSDARRALASVLHSTDHTDNSVGDEGAVRDPCDETVTEVS
jgi:RNA polymerase sigma-70 factor (ECF subfamily)